MILAVSGTRDETVARDKAYRIRICLELASTDACEEYELIHGGATGVDRIAAEWAKSRNIPVREFPADWNRHGKAAGPIRNLEMAKAGADLLLAFPWVKSCNGTRDCINAFLAEKVDAEVHWLR